MTQGGTIMADLGGPLAEQRLDQAIAIIDEEISDRSFEMSEALESARRCARRLAEAATKIAAGTATQPARAAANGIGTEGVAAITAAWATINAARDALKPDVAGIESIMKDIEALRRAREVLEQAKEKGRGNERRERSDEPA